MDSSSKEYAEAALPATDESSAVATRLIRCGGSSDLFRLFHRSPLRHLTSVDGGIGRDGRHADRHGRLGLMGALPVGCSLDDLAGTMRLRWRIW
jgi:hypothetical protein